MFGWLMSTTVATWALLSSPVEGWRRFETTLLYQPYVNETVYMSLGCLAGAAGGATVGSLPVVTGFGVTVVPMTVEAGLVIGCTAGLAAGAVASKAYNAGLFYAKHAGGR